MPEWELWGDAARRAATVALAWLLLANAGIGVAAWRDRRRHRGDDEKAPRLPLPGDEDDEGRLPRRLRPPRVELWHRVRAREGSRNG